MLPSRVHPQRGFALVLVLGFVVLLTFVVVAFFSDSIFERRVSSGSADQSKVELFARGALDTTVGDLRQEIAAGSTPVTVTAGNTSSTVYLPKSATGTAASTMVPAYQITTNFAPTFTGGVETDGLANVLKLSAGGLPFYSSSSNANYSNVGPSRAASVSTLTPSQKGHYISLARWNLPLLMQATSTTDPTPAAAVKFPAPHWVLVANDGSNPTAVSSTTVGRYAYVIYNEGGLLDVNVAGYPPEMDQPTAAHKMGVATADLTQIGLTATQVDNIVGLRNYASAQPSGSFPAFSFLPANGLTYYNAAFGNTTGFMANGNTALNNNQSDQRFASRQQLMDVLLRGIANGSTNTSLISALQNSLQYLGTFSRTVDQPSFRPDPTRPLVKGYASTTSSTSSFAAPGAGGNNAYQLDNVINPFFLQVPVTATFTRNDGVTVAVVGEPLVKTRFGLNKLAWVTYKGPSADVYMSNPSDPVIGQMLNQGIPLQTIKNGTDSNVKSYFGLTWSNTNNDWTYAPDANTRIDRLTDLQGTREPNFFELLKAAVTVGSIGKSSASQHGSGSLQNFPLDVQQYNLDTSTDLQIIQIGANIVDQFDSDSYPTHIVFQSQDCYGDENIPYLYRDRGTSVDVGTTGLMMMLPEVWNPHSPPYSANNVPIAGPTNFRFLATSYPGTTITVTPQCRAYPTTSQQSEILGYIPAKDELPVSPPPLDTTTAVASGKTELDFTVPLGTTAQQYYEPFFLGGEKNAGGTSVGTASIGQAPTSNTASQYGGNAGFVTDVNSKLKYCGVVLGTFPLQFSTTDYVVVNPGQGGTYTVPSPAIFPFPVPPANTLNPSSTDQCILTLNTGGGVDYYLQYQDASQNWVTYEQNTAMLPTLGQASCARGGQSPGAPGGPGEPVYLDISGNQFSGAAVVDTNDTGNWLTWLDPRTSRFGCFGNNFERPATASPFTSTGPYYGETNQPAAGAFGQCSYLYVPSTGLSNNLTASGSAPGIGWYPGNWTGAGAPTMFVPGYYAQNVTGNQSSPQNNGNFYADPDGVVRRAMGGYAGAAPTTTLGLAHAALASSSTQVQSRPLVLNRPFRSVAELGYTFSGTPWRNIDFTFPESGYSALLDVFCVDDTPDPNALKAGKIDLNTRQVQVLTAVLSGTNNQGTAYNAYKEEEPSQAASGTTSLSPTEVQQIATALLARTTSTAVAQGPLANVSELVGKWNGQTVGASGATAPYNVDGSQSYSGFSGDLSTLFSDSSTPKIARLRESAIRALADAGQTRTWNLMIDLIAQTGRYPVGTTSLSNFAVDGEQRYWLHVAIDRYTGKVVDEQVERVKE